MKAHQNRNMNYDEMHDYVMFNEAAHPARGNLLSLCYHKYSKTRIYQTRFLRIHGVYRSVIKART